VSKKIQYGYYNAWARKSFGAYVCMGIDGKHKVCTTVSDEPLALDQAQPYMFYMGAITGWVREFEKYENLTVPSSWLIDNNVAWYNQQLLEHPNSPKCDCGGKKAGTTHSHWCSTNG